MVEARNDIRYEPASRANAAANDALSSAWAEVRAESFRRDSDLCLRRDFAFDLRGRWAA
jgi:hypothetical protein